jgi:Ca2+-binding EF-hand superfamily protein
MLKSIAVGASILCATVAFAQQPPQLPPGGRPSVEQIFGFLDADKDGFIAKEEAPGPMAQHFEHIDANKDGKISPEELKTVMEARRPPEPANDEADD